MKYKTLVLERGIRGRKLKESVRIRVPVRRSVAEKRLLQYIVESLSGRSRLIPFALKNLSTMKIARHLLFNRPLLEEQEHIANEIGERLANLDALKIEFAERIDELTRLVRDIALRGEL